MIWHGGERISCLMNVLGQPALRLPVDSTFSYGEALKKRLMVSG